MCELLHGWYGWLVIYDCYGLNLVSPTPQQIHMVKPKSLIWYQEMRPDEETNEEIRFRWGYKARAFLVESVPLKKRNLFKRRERACSPQPTPPPPLWGHNEKAVIYKPGSAPFARTWPYTDTMIADSQLPGLWENKFLLFKPPRLWSFVMTAQAETLTIHLKPKTFFHALWKNFGFLVLAQAF